MAKLIDKNKTEWELKFGFRVFTKVFKRLGITFDSLTKLELNVGELLESIPEICEKQIKERGISKEEFIDLLDDIPISIIIASFTSALNESLQTGEVQEVIDDDETPLPLGTGTTS